MDIDFKIYMKINTTLNQSKTLKQKGEFNLCLLVIGYKNCERKEN